MDNEEKKLKYLRDNFVICTSALAETLGCLKFLWTWTPQEEIIIINNQLCSGKSMKQ